MRAQLDGEHGDEETLAGADQRRQEDDGELGIHRPLTTT
jgi:hypothetical protein